MKKIFLISSLLVLGACESVTVNPYIARYQWADFSHSSFEPLSEDKFRFSAILDYVYTDEAGEEARMMWLDRHLDNSAMCVGGYKITDRKSIPYGKSGNRISYKGHCV